MVSTENMSMEYVGLSTDEKPVDGVGNGSTFVEMDTKKFYIFDEDSKTWIVQN